MEIPQLAQAALTGSERLVAQAVLDGYNDLEIAQLLGLSVNTVKKHLCKMYRRAGLWRGSRIQLAAALLGVRIPPIF
jgi:DNA-binding NarL/FixJ family response regulator